MTSSLGSSHAGEFGVVWISVFGYFLGLCLWLVVALLSFCLRGDIAEFGVVVRSAWLICLRLVVVSPLLQCRCGSVEFGLSMRCGWGVDVSSGSESSLSGSAGGESTGTRSWMLCIC